MTPAVVYNGHSGGLGRHFDAALANHHLAAWPLHSRLGDTAHLSAELQRLPIDPGSPVTFIQSAGMTSVSACETDPALAFEVNVNRTATTVSTFIEWSTANNNRPGIVFVSSGHVYAPPKPGALLQESSPVEPQSVYAKTKLEGEHQIRSIATEHGVDLTIGRVFGMIGPDQRSHYLLPGLIRRIRSGDLAEIPGLDHVRDYLDTRDVSRHLASLASAQSGSEHDRHEILVNVCSGEETRIGDFLDQLLSLFYEDDSEALRQARSRVGAAPGRPTDIKWSVGDPTLLSQVVPGPILLTPIADTLAEALSAPAGQT